MDGYTTRGTVAGVCANWRQPLTLLGQDSDGIPSFPEVANKQLLEPTGLTPFQTSGIGINPTTPWLFVIKGENVTELQSLAVFCWSKS